MSFFYASLVHRTETHTHDLNRLIRKKAF